MILKNFRLLNGKGEPAKEGIMIRVKDGVIADIAEEISAEDEILDLSGMTVLPGLIDLHVHLGGAVELTDPPMQGSEEMYSRKCEMLLDKGVTSVRSGGDFEKALLKFRRDRGNSIPRIFACGKSFQAAMGHPVYTVWGGAREVAEETAYFVTDRKKIKNEVRRQKAAGADHIKAFLCDFNVMTGEEVPALSGEDIRAIAAAAHECGMKLMVHCESPADVLTALEAGADTIEHMVSSGAPEAAPPEKVKEEFLRTEACFIPTLAIRHCISKLTDVCDPREEILRDTVKDYFESGVDIALGTDSGVAGVPIGEAAHIELELLCKAGIPPVKALQMAGEKAASVLGREDLGVIEIGALADLIVIAGRPDECISDIRKISMVMLGGKIVR